jgi:hypothetical protein
MFKISLFKHSSEGRQAKAFLVPGLIGRPEPFRFVEQHSDVLNSTNLIILISLLLSIDKKLKQFKSLLEKVILYCLQKKDLILNLKLSLLNFSKHLITSKLFIIILFIIILLLSLYVSNRLIISLV